MLVPAALVPRIVAAFRGTYPGVTEGLEDDPAVRAVLKYWVVSTLTAYEGQQAEAALPAAIEALRQEHAELGRLARAKATADAAEIVEAPPLRGEV